MARTQVTVTDLTPAKATLTTSLTGSNNDLKFTARKGGSWGNSIQVAYIDPSANDATISVDVDGFVISVNLATNGSGTITSTGTLVKNAIQASPDAAALVEVALAGSDTGAGVVTALSASALTGGSYGTAQPAQTTADATADHYLTGNDGTVVLEVVSSDGGAQTVTIQYSPKVSVGVTTDPEVVSVGAGVTALLGPFAPNVFNQNSDGDVYFAPSVSTTLKFRAYKTIKA